MLFKPKYFRLFILLLLITSCATVKQNENITVREKLTVLDNSRFSDETNIRIRANISFKFPDASNSANAIIEMAKRDSIFITISGPFGISVGKLYANPNEFIMNNNLQNTTFIGIPTENNIMQIANIPLSFNDLMSILRTTSPQNSDKYFYNSDLSVFELSKSPFTKNELYRESIFTNLNNDISRIERKNLFGQTEIVAIFSEHYSVGKHRFAKKINLNFPLLNGNVEIKISDISILSQPTTPMRFAKPRTFREFRFE